MKPTPLTALAVAGLLAMLSSTPAPGQELTPSGTRGLDLVYATSPTGTSQLYAISLVYGTAPIPVGDAVATVPSRWAHRRRTLGALETSSAYVEPGVLLTPMGDAVGTGALHFIDARVSGQIVDRLVATGNPAGYDLAVCESLAHVFSVEDDGAGNTVLRGFSFATPGDLVPLDPPSLVLAGSPCAGVSRMGLDESGLRLHVPAVGGIHVVELRAATPHMVLATTVSTAPAVSVTNPAAFDRNGTTTWVAGTSLFNGNGDPIEAGFIAWNATGASESGAWGAIPALAPPRSYVPAAGTTELAVVGNGVDSWAYFLLRDPSPTAAFIRPSAIGVIRFLGSAAAAMGSIPYPDEGGEPFAIPTVQGTRIAIESSQGPPFSTSPPDGGEPVSILYTPLDPLGAGTLDGVLAVPTPLGGRISTKGMDRPLWTRDGTRVVACTSHFPGAPNPGSPGVEVLNVPATVPLNFYNAPHYVVPNFVSPHRSIVFPAPFQPRHPQEAAFLDGLSFVGNVFHNGMASILVAPFGEIGQLTTVTEPYVQSVEIPNFPAINPPSFDDPGGSLVPVPGSFGARRTTWNLYPGVGLFGLALTAAVDEKILVQPSGANFLINLGLIPGDQADPIEVTLPAGWITTTEFVSL